MYYNIRHCAFKQARACFPMSCVFLFFLKLNALFSCSSREPRGITRVTRAPLFTPFLHWFSDLIFNTERSLKSSEPGPKTTTSQKNQQKRHHQDAPTTKTCKKAPSGKSQTSEIDNLYKTFSCFSISPEISK